MSDPNLDPNLFPRIRTSIWFPMLITAVLFWLGVYALGYVIGANI